MRLRLLLLITFFSLVAAACDGRNQASTAVMDSSAEKISSESYHKDGIAAEYPKLTSGGTKEERDEINKLIFEDFNKILRIYAFQPFPELTPSPAAESPVILNINYVIKQNTDKLISILYHAEFNSPSSAHPTDLVYTTNINKKDKVRIKLSDMFKINKAFVKDFREWKFIPREEGNEEINQAIRDYFTHMTDEDLLMGFQSADLIGSDNLWGMYSYLTPDRLGISIGVPNYIGDHVEFEREYSKLKDYLKIELP